VPCPYLSHRVHDAAGDSELPDEVRLTVFECEGLDKDALAVKLESASFADLVAVTEALGF